MPRPFDSAVTSAGLARMLSLDPSGDLWPASDLGDLLLHQLNASILADLRRCAAIDDAALTRIETEYNAATHLTFRKILHDLPAPLELLRAVKDFGKSAYQIQCPIPPQVGLVLYYTSIIVARLGHGVRITAMDDATLRQGLEWVINQTWVDEKTLDRCRAGLAEPAA